jgi:hypothetical protein
VLEASRSEIQALFDELAETLVPEFILSTDFYAYFETTAASKSVGMNVDSEKWQVKFKRALQLSKFPVHLIPRPSGRPYANAKMRKLFGALCDATAPKDYIDSSTPAHITDEIMRAFNGGIDATLPVTCHTPKQQNMEMTMLVKSIYLIDAENEDDDELRYTYVHTNNIRILLLISRCLLHVIFASTIYLLLNSSRFLVFCINFPRLPVCLPVCLSVCLPTCLPACLPTYLPACLPVYLPASLPACSSISLDGLSNNMASFPH